jgi:hypothetical protein
LSANEAIVNGWLEITVLANASTGLSVEDVFYFGSEVATPTVFGDEQLALVQANYGSLGPDGDYTNDGVVDFNDLIYVLRNWGQEIPTVTEPEPEPEPEPVSDIDVAIGTRGDIHRFAFAPLDVGQRNTRRLTVHNRGEAELIVSQALAGGAESPFMVVRADDGDASNPWAIAPGQSMDLVVFYRPTAAGDHADLLTLTSNDPDEANYEISLTGTAMAEQGPDINVAIGTRLDVDRFAFAPLNLGDRNTRRFTVHNLGESELIVSSSLTLGQDSPFFIKRPDGGDASNPWTVAAGQSMDLVVFYRPTTAGDHADLLTLTSNDPDQPAYTISLTGTALAQAEAVSEITTSLLAVNEASTLQGPAPTAAPTFAEPIIAAPTFEQPIVQPPSPDKQQTLQLARWLAWEQERERRALLTAGLKDAETEPLIEWDDADQATATNSAVL